MISGMTNRIRRRVSFFRISVPDFVFQTRSVKNFRQSGNERCVFRNAAAAFQFQRVRIQTAEFPVVPVSVRKPDERDVLAGDVKEN